MAVETGGPDLDVGATRDGAGLAPQVFVDRARDLRGLLHREQDATESARIYGPEIHRAFQEAGFYQLLVPRRFGGHEVDLETFLRVVMEVGRGCLDSAWALSLLANRPLQVAELFDAEVQQEVFAGDGFRAASVASPSATAVRTAGGWLLHGTARYCSGLPWASWFLGQATVEGSDTTGVFLVPRSAFAPRGDWGDLLGMRGTGSDTLDLDGARVTDRYFLEGVDLFDVPVHEGTPGLRLHGNPLYAGRSMFVFTAALAAPVVGGGRGALDEYAASLRDRTSPLPPRTSCAEDPDHQRRYGSALVGLDVAEAALRQSARAHEELCRVGATGGSYDQAADLRLAATAREICVTTCEIVLRDLTRSAGSSSLRTGTRWERIARNFIQVSGHQNLALRERMFREVGADVLGVDPSIRRESSHGP